MSDVSSTAVWIKTSIRNQVYWKIYRPSTINGRGDDGIIKISQTGSCDTVMNGEIVWPWKNTDLPNCKPNMNEARSNIMSNDVLTTWRQAQYINKKRRIRSIKIHDICEILDWNKNEWNITFLFQTQPQFTLSNLSAVNFHSSKNSLYPNKTVNYIDKLYSAIAEEELQIIANIF